MDYEYVFHQLCILQGENLEYLEKKNNKLSIVRDYKKMIKSDFIRYN